MTDAPATELLPKQSSTPYEIANLQAHIGAYSLVDAIPEIAIQGDPMLCDTDKLSLLPFDKGLVFFRDSWPEIKQRQTIRDGWVYKRIEGTPLGVEAYLNLADGALIREVLPPAEAFAIEDTGLTHAQVLALMPQLRLYYHWPDKDFPVTANFADRAFADRLYAYPDQGEALGRYPVIYDPATGVETPLGTVSYDEVSTTVVLGTAGYTGTAFYADVAYADLSFAGAPLGDQPITFELADPDMQTVRASPALRSCEFAGDFSYADRTFVFPDIGDVGTYDFLTLYDPSRIPTGVSVARSAFYADWSWLGLPPYTEILTVAVPGTPVEMPYAAFTADVGFALSNDQSSLFDAVEAIALSKRGGDRVLLDLAQTFAGTRAATLPAMQDI